MSIESNDLVQEAEIQFERTGSSQSSILVVTFFALSCFYFIITVLSVTRLCKLD